MWRLKRGLVWAITPCGSVIGVFGQSQAWAQECVILEREGGVVSSAAPTLWPNGVLPYEFDPAIPSANRDVILAVMEEYEARAEVQFVPRSAEADWVFMSADGSLCSIPDSGCSFVGMVGGRQDLVVVSPAVALARHEIGHLLGRWHEQQRSDRDRFVTVHYENITEPSQFDIRTEPLHGPYDFGSVMHYNACSFRTESCTPCPQVCRTMSAVPPYDEFFSFYFRMGYQQNISYWDTYVFRQLYGSGDCDGNAIPDANENFTDCNRNNLPDSCDIALGSSSDCDSNSVLDECDPDCNKNGVPDACDIASPTSDDCNQNGIPDECLLAGPARRIYHVPVEDLLNVPSTCGCCSGPYNRELAPGGGGDCVLHPGIRWLDTSSDYAWQIDAALSIGVELSPGTVRTTSFNGFSTDSFPAIAQDGCGVSDTASTRSLSLDSWSYFEGQLNHLFIALPPEVSQDNCIGFDPWPNGSESEPYAYVDVWYRGETDCNRNGVPDNCESNVEVLLVSTCYGCDDTLSKTRRNVLGLEFACPVSLPPSGGLVEIQELGSGGTYVGADLADRFDFSLEQEGRVLRIEEDGCRGGTCNHDQSDPRCLDGDDVDASCATVLSHETWYTVKNGGSWSGVQQFNVDYGVLRGDANNDGFTDFGDLSYINEFVDNPAGDDDRSDIDSDGYILFADMSAAYAYDGAVMPAKPSGHVCTSAGTIAGCGGGQ